MAARVAWLLHVSHSDPDVRRRGRLLITVDAGILVLALTFSPALILIPDGPVYIVAILFATAVAMLAIAAARRGRVQLAVLVFLTNYVIAILASVVWVGEVTSGPLFCLLIVTLAGALLGRSGHLGWRLGYGSARFLRVVGKFHPFALGRGALGASITSHDGEGHGPPDRGHPQRWSGSSRLVRRDS